MKIKYRTMGYVPDKKSIAEAVLNGESASALAKKSGVSCRVVYRILNRYCLEANPSFYRRILTEAGHPFYEYPVGVLRRHKVKFLNRLHETKIGIASSIWLLEGISSVTLSGLYKNGIDTIRDFMKFTNDELCKLQQVHIDGVCKVRAVIVDYGIAEQTHSADEGTGIGSRGL